MDSRYLESVSRWVKTILHDLEPLNRELMQHEKHYMALTNFANAYTSALEKQTSAERQLTLARIARINAEKAVGVSNFNQQRYSGGVNLVAQDAIELQQQDASRLSASMSYSSNSRQQAIERETQAVRELISADVELIQATRQHANIAEADASAIAMSERALSAYQQQITSTIAQQEALRLSSMPANQSSIPFAQDQASKDFRYYASLRTQGGGGDYSEAITKTKALAKAQNTMATTSALAQQRFKEMNPPINSVTNSIVKNIGSFLKWSIAMSAVMIPLRLIIDGFKELIQVQHQLARSSLLLGGTQEDLAKHFDAVMKGARGLGLEISDSIQGYEEVLKVTKSISDEQERAIATTELYADAVLLATVANIEVAEAVDMLTGVYKKWGIEISDIESVLNSVVRTQTEVGGSTEGLSESLAKSGELARSAGLQMNEFLTLAGLFDKVATGDKDFGQFFETLYSKLYSPEGLKALDTAGIETTGKNLQELLDGVYESQQRLSPEKYTELINAIAGKGNRGELRDLVAIMNEYSDSLERVNGSNLTIQESAKMVTDNFSDSMKSLSNALLELFTAFGGMSIIDNFTESVQGATQIIQGFADILNHVSEVTGIASGNIAEAIDKFNELSNIQIPPIFLTLAQLFNPLDGVNALTLAGESFEMLIARAEYLEKGDATRMLEIANRTGMTEGAGGAPLVTTKLPSGQIPDPTRNVPIGFDDINTQQFQSIIFPMAQSLQEAYITAVSAGNADLAQTMREEFEKPYIGEFGAGNFSDIPDSVAEQFYKQAIGLAEDQGLIGGDIQQSQLGLTSLPIARSELSSVMPAYQQLLTGLRGYGLELPEEEAVVQFDDGQFDKFTFNQEVMNILLGQISDNTKEMVEGVYNLPADGSVLVPLTGAMTTPANRPDGFGGIEGKLTQLLDFLLLNNNASVGEDFMGGSKADFHTTINLNSNLVVDGKVLATTTETAQVRKLMTAMGASGRKSNVLEPF